MSIQYTAEQLQRKFPGPAGAPGFPRLADVLRAEGRTDEAIDLCREGLRVRPGALSGYLVLGKTLMETGRMEEAQEQFEAALRLDPRCLSAMHHLARIMVRLQWSDAAAGYYRSILEVEPWDEGIRSRLEESGTAQEEMANPESSTARREFAPIADAPAGGEEDTYHKPDGFSGDVMEVNLNDLADDFLPGRDGTDMLEAEESLEEALSFPKEEARPAPEAAATVAIPEPMPQDILKDEPLEMAEGMEGGKPPISGEDVEERLDSLFGSEDGPAGSGPSPTSTWTAAPAEAEPDIETDQVTETFPEAKAEEFSAANAPALPEESLYRDEPSEVSGESALSAFPEEAVAAGDAGEEESRVQGEDIEKRLDELFNLAGADAQEYPAAAALPVAPAPRIEEAVSLGESVPFGGDASGRDAGAYEGTIAKAPASESGIPEAGPEETMVAETAGAENTVTGQDVADKLDSLFGIEDAGQTAEARPEARAAEVRERDAMIGASGATEAFLKTDIEDMEMPAIDMPSTAGAWEDPAPVPAEAHPIDDATARVADAAPEVPGEVDFMTTVSLPPSGWSDEVDAASRVTGEDVEAQLDKLFGLVEDGESFKPAQAKVEEPMPDLGGSGDRTLFMPAFHGASDQGTGSGGDPDGKTAIKEDVAEWLARRNEDAESRAAEAGPSSDATAAPSAEGELFGALAPEEHGDLSDTATIEMVDGADVAERLDRLFASGEGEMSLFPGEGGEPAIPQADNAQANAAAEPQDGEAMVSGEDVSSRLSEMFEPESGAAKADAGVPAVPALSEAARATGFAPMSDEEDGYPEEEELPPQDGPGANVATVTLAEIYFQQGLKEQALQIYRQLLEREPENESVRARIEEIEATKPEDGDRGPGTDQRRPRPGLKVPKRKK